MSGPSGVRLRDRGDFVRFWTASTVSVFGSYVTTVAVSVLIVETLHEGAAGVGIVNAARWLPYLLFGVVAGVLVDRVRRLPLLILTDLGRGALLLAVPLLAALDRLGLTTLAVLMSLVGLLSLAGDAAAQSFLPRLVPGPLLARANARLDLSSATAQTSGPALAGLLVAALTAPWAVLVDAVSYLGSALLLIRMRVEEPASRGGSLAGVRTEAIEGLRWVYRHRTLTPQALAAHAWFLVNAVATTVVPVFALRTHDYSALGFGLLLSAAGIGAVAGSLVATRLAHGLGVGRTVISGYAVMALGWGLVASSVAGTAGWIPFAIGQLLVGLAMGGQNASEMAYRQLATPDQLQARTNATIRSINRAMIVIGAPVGGLLADRVGTRPMLASAAVGFLLVATVVALTPFRDARLDDAYAAPPQPI